MATQTSLESNHLLPRSLPASIPWLWRRVAFPTREPVSTAVRPLALLVVLILPALLLYPCLEFRLLEPDEGRYAEIPREMLQRGEWVVPHLQGQPYLDKPPLLYWLVMISYSIFGVHDWAARIVPALAVHASILATYLIGRRSLGERPAWWGALVLSVMPGFVTMGRLLILDGLLAACTTLAILSAFEAVRGPRLEWRWWTFAAIMTGFGALTKGPVALLLLVPPLWLHRRLAGQACRIGVKPILAFLAIVAGVNLPWYIAMGFREPEFLRYFLWEHNVVRFVAPFDHIRPVWFFIPIVLLGMMPGTLAVPGLLRDLLSGDPARIRFRTPAVGFFFLAGSWCVVFFSLSGSKLPTYILPAFPFLALTVGAYIAAGVYWRQRLTAALVVLAIGFLAVSHYLTIPWYATMRSPMGEPERVARYCADPAQPIVCFPRSCDSVSFYLRRDDLRNTRSKNVPEMMAMLRQHPRTVVLFTHRHSLEALRYSLPADLVITEVVTFRRDPGVGKWYDVLATETPWGLCDLAVVERRP